MARRPTATEWNTLRSMFPQLPQSSVWVLGNATPVYNCLAWALGRTDRWIWPWGGSLPSLATFTSYLRQFGYATGTPAAAAVYGNAAWGSYAIAHIGRHWVGAPSSKLGRYLLIHHTWAGLNYGAYGALRQYYRRVAALEGGPPTLESVDMVERGESPLPELAAAELQALQDAADKVPQDARAAFDAAYSAWRATWDEPPGLLDSTGLSLTTTLQFYAVVDASRKAVPLLMLKLVDPNEHPALLAAEQVIPATAMPLFELDDPATLEGEQYRARIAILSWLAGQ
jgi:hypothetical protein